MKKNILLLFLLLIVILPLNVDALSVDKNNLTIAKGEDDSVSLYANVEAEVTEISFTLVYTTYDVPAYFNLESGLTDRNPNGIAHKIIFSNPVSGKIKLGTIDIDVVNNPKESYGTINIHSGKATTNNGTVNLNAQTINVTIGKEEENTTPTITTEEPDEEKPKEEVKKNLLEKIESKIVNIKLKENVYEYTVKIKEDIEELDLKPIAKDEDYKIEISSQKIEELEDNKIVIKVIDGDNTEEYIVKVNKESNKIEDIEIDNEEFESSFKYKGKWITIIIIMSVVLVVGLVLAKKK